MLVVTLEDLPRLVLLLLVEHAVLTRVEPEEVSARLVQVLNVFRDFEQRRVSDDADRGGTVDDEVDRVAATCEEFEVWTISATSIVSASEASPREREEGRDHPSLPLGSLGRANRSRG